MEEASVRRLNGLQLAFIGDTVYDLYARGRALEEHDESVRQLHRRAVARPQGRRMQDRLRKRFRRRSRNREPVRRRPAGVVRRGWRSWFN